MEQNIQFTLNGKPAELKTDPGRSLLWVLRGDLALTGTKYGCGEGLCGACAVLVEDRVQRACTLSIGDVAGKRVTTIEGLATDGQLHPVQQAFIDHDALQCGYCTPGMIVTAAGLLAQNPRAKAADVVAGLENNLCRCGAHRRIVAAVQAVTDQGRD
jgi:carbon-monoxide dehydrogenase small subunit